MRTSVAFPSEFPSLSTILRLLTSCLAWVFMLAAAETSHAAASAETLRITEFMASNFRTLADEDGDWEDWIEIHNSGLEAANLQGYYLTDSKLNLKRWQFPSVEVPANGYLIVFASNKNRRQPFTPLHTNFKLSARDGYLALVGTNGTSVLSEFNYPVQAQGVSYGVPILDNPVPLILTNSPVRYWVPLDDQHGRAWTAADYPDGNWTTGANGLGYDADPSITQAPVVLADSIREFSGVQGSNNWFYGYWDQGRDPNGVYAPSEFTPFPRGAGVLSPSNFFTNNIWRWFPLNAARTEINRLGGNATAENGNPEGENHWTIRRWISETNGVVRIHGTVADDTTCVDLGQGDGTTFRIVSNGVEIFRRTLRQSSTGYSVVTTLTQGTPVDFIIESGTALNDLCDSAAFTALVTTMSPTHELFADSTAQWSTSGDQGAGGWEYGNFNRAADAVSGYQVGDFRAFPEDFWNGEAYSWLNGKPPFDYIGRDVMHPNGIASSGGEHWVIKRWVAKVGGTLTVDWHVAKAVKGGSGVTARLFHKGGTAKDVMAITGTNMFGTNRTVTLTGVLPGDAIDIALEPAGAGTGGDDAADLAFLNVRIFGNASLASYAVTDVGTAVQGKSSSLFVRIPFTMPPSIALDQLKLRMRYDAGFAAYLNGVEVLRRNSPAEPAWNSTATEERPDVDAGSFETFDLTARQDLIKAGANVLAIQAMNSSAADPDLLSAALLTGSYLTLDPESPRYFAAPTPGVPNGFGNTNLGPVIASAQHTPKVPKPGENLLVTARVSATFQAISNVWLTYRVMYGAETNILMSDDGQSGDGQSGDGVYGATIPASAYKAGQMVRYYVRAWDVNSNLTRDPVFTRGKLAPEYWGTIVHNPALTNPLPVFYWFAQTADPVGSPGASSIYWNGQFLDNVRFTVHGQSSSGFTKRSFNVDLNPGHKLIWKDGEPSIDDINLLTTYPDKAKMRNLLAYNTYRDAGTAYHFVVPIRIEANGAFLGDWHFVENGDDNYLKRVGLDPRGALYKMYNTFDAPDGEKKTRKFEGTSMADLQEFHTGMGLAGSAQLTYVYDNLNIPEVVNYLATMTLTANTDCCHKNYYFYRDTEGTGEWMMLPWDQDLSFGRVWSGGPTYWDDTMYTNTALRVGGNNRVPSAIFSNPGFDQMYLRRLRSLMEELLQAPGTPAHLLKYERTINELLPTLIPDAALDLAKWGTFSGDSTAGSQTDNRNRQTVEQAANILKHEYLPGRRNWLFNSSDNAQIPKSQPSNPNLLFGAFEFNPPSGNQDEEYFTLINTNRVFIDISHWKIKGAVEMTFQGGTVIPTNGTLYVAADVRRFRARQTGARGGQRLFVQGGYKGRLSARGEMIQLVNRQGEVLSQTNSPAAPSSSQSNLRVTEIMYHPAPPPANSPYLADDFEYIELTNIGDSTLSLAGVRFVSGIEFSIASSAGAPSIEAGKSVLLVRNPAAFVSRYGNSLPTIGQYTGTLSDDGENLRIVDASGEVIQDFTYNNSWYPITDGFGFSLVIIDARAPWNTWSEKSSWRPSGRFQGSPGDGDPAAPAFQPVIINEILANSTLDPEGDAIELLNPGSGAADISGWYLTDDFNTPKKHRIAPGSTIAPGAYRVIRESTFNTGNPGSFAMSSNGDEIYLFSADASGQLTGYVTGYQFGATGPGTTMGRHTNSLGEVFFVPQRSATLGQPNSSPATGPVVISEIMYHPLESDTGEQSRRMEYVELRNVTDQFVPLFDPNQPTNTWSIGGGIEWVFAPGLNLAPNASLLLVNFNPADNESRNAFVEAYAVPAGIQMFGPYGGQLDNSSEDIELYRPGVASLNNPTPRILVDWAAYSDASPWDVLADGFGPALTRRPFESFGVDPLSWRAVKPTPGYDQTATIPPTISGGRETFSILRGQLLSLAFSISGSEPMEYRWFHDGLPLSGQRSRDLNIPSIGFLDWGAYQQVAMNASGAAISSTQTVIVQQTAVFLRQPVSRNVLPGSNVTFTVTASGQGRLRYQWLYNDQMIPDATNSSFQVRAVTPANEGEYRALVTDDVAPVLSDAAMLAVFDRPQILSQPQPVAVLAGETASFTVRVGGRSPFGYRWQRASITRSNMTSRLHVNTFAITNVSTSLTGNYSVVITNLAGASTNSAVASLSVLLDADGDRIADSWELAYGLSGANAEDAVLDSDGDGVSNLDEYRGGTNPNDPTSYLKITRLDPGLTSTQIEFLAGSNRTYTVEFRESVGAGNWQTLTNVMVQTQTRVETIVDPYPASRSRLYRLVSPALFGRPPATPVILQSPAASQGRKGTPVSLWVEASGEGTLQYQWLKGGQVIGGATSSTLVFPSLAVADQGQYAVRVSDQFGVVETAPASLVVLDPPVILAGPQGGLFAAGSHIRLTVQAQGNNPLQYIWLFNGQRVPDAEGPELVLPSATTASSGRYQVIVRHNTSNGVVASETDEIEILVQ